MNLKDCKKVVVPFLTVGQVLDADFTAEPMSLHLPPGAQIAALAQAGDGAHALLFYTVTAQGLPQEDIDRLVRLAVRKGRWLTEKDALAGLTEHGLHQFGAAHLSDLTPEQYREMVKTFRFEVGAPVSVA